MISVKNINRLEDALDKVVHGDGLEFVKKLPDNCVDMICTSPPYWQLRDYGVAGQYGLEDDFKEYINNLYSFFEEAKRVLKKEGSAWVNLGDCYNENSGGYFDNKNNDAPQIGKHTIKSSKYQPQFPRRSLLMIPYRFAIKMIDDGDWLCRNMIIWKKNKVRPTTAQNRFTIDFEPLFLFTKSQRYYFNIEASRWIVDEGDLFSEPTRSERRSVWDIGLDGGGRGHKAPYPRELASVPILAACPPGGVVLDPFLGSGTTAVVAQELGCHFLGCDLNKEYCEKAEKRLCSSASR